MPKYAKSIFRVFDKRWQYAAYAAAQTIVSRRSALRAWCWIGWDWKQLVTPAGIGHVYGPAWFDQSTPPQNALAGIAGQLIFDEGLGLPQLCWNSAVLQVAEELNLKHRVGCTNEACMSSCDIGPALDEAYPILTQDKTLFMGLRIEVYRFGIVSPQRVKELFDEHSDFPLDEADTSWGEQEVPLDDSCFDWSDYFLE